MPVRTTATRTAAVLVRTGHAWQRSPNRVESVLISVELHDGHQGHTPPLSQSCERRCYLPRLGEHGGLRFAKDVTRGCERR